ncbi:nuclear transport factor 2 family protein [Pseudomonas brenneri]|uniref:YybH family protein n=1 Tax=Pseudomonas brenneri TaxID=129817 RepID=UPI003570E71F
MNTQVNSEISTLIEQWKQAVTAKDVDKIVSFYAQDIVAFDAVTALQFKGRKAYKAHWQACMEMCPGGGIFEFHQMNIVAATDSAFAHWLARCGGTGPDGVEKVCWMRVTAGYQRINGQWQVVHEHWSAPFDMQSGTALFDLQP